MTKPNKNNIDEVLESKELYRLASLVGTDAKNPKDNLKTFLKQKLQQVEEHETENGYCCACEYDIACMNEKIEIAIQKKVEEIREELEKMDWNYDVDLGEFLSKKGILNLKSLKTKE